MNIFLMAYARKNLGDDLFVKMLLERYPMHNFYMNTRDLKWLDKLNEYENLNVSIGEDTDEELYKHDVNEYDAYIYIGGSIFMEGGKVYNLSEKFYDFVRRCKENNKPFCYVSSNYGPYQTQEYFELSRKNFEKCTDICFRDKYSYDLFKDITSVRYAPDFAFTYEINNEDKIDNSVGISIIDLSIRNDLKDLQTEYINCLVNNIRNYLSSGKKVYLYSFCEYEGDERTLNSILEHFTDKDNIYDIRYDGDVDKFLNIYSKMEYMICSRFHAMILSTIAKQKMYVISYSNKITNVINDLELNIPVLNFKDVTCNKNIVLDDFVCVENKKIENIVVEAQGQEEIINIILKNNRQI